MPTKQDHRTRPKYFCRQTFTNLHNPLTIRNVFCLKKDKIKIDSIPKVVEVTKTKLV